jgi:hypothetical protein
MMNRCQSLLILALLLATAGCGPEASAPSGSEGDDEVIASLGAADAPRAAGVREYQILVFNAQRVKLNALGGGGTRLATYSATRTSSGFTAEVIGGYGFTDPVTRVPSRLRLTQTAVPQGANVKLSRTMTDGRRTVALEQIFGRSSRQIVSVTWRVDGRSLTFRPGDDLYRVQSFLSTTGALNLLQGSLARLLQAIGKDPGVHDYGRSVVSEIDWGAGLGCLVDVARGAAAGGVVGAVVGGATSSDCWSFVSSWWD